ncbi:DUF3043 domain-containing protein [Luteococcus sp. OSA5]|uniref:DUF3043 domain-containing protein n=1 Tax=Luteococcus sp. OSA5 TaxID=3401630 RepID=UPI003B43388C
MGLFRPYEQGKTDQPTSGGSSAVTPRPPGQRGTDQQGTDQQGTGQDGSGETRRPQPQKNQPQKKGTRTPTRAEAEAARMARLHPTLSPKEAKKAKRRADREARYKALEDAERSPERRLVRDHVDSQITFTEFTIPTMLAIMVVSIWFSRNLVAQQITSLLMFGIFAIWIVNIFLRWRSFKALAYARGMDPKQRGLMMYMINRMMTIRALRRPEPRIKRGEAY